MKYDEWHTEEPEDSNLRLLAIHGVQKKFIRRVGWYDKSMLSGEWTVFGHEAQPLHVIKWAYLLDANQ